MKRTWVILKKIKGLLILLTTFLLRTFFLMSKETKVAYTYPDDDVNTYPYFCNDTFLGSLCLSDVELYKDTHAYFIYQHLIFIAYGVYMLIEATKYRVAIKIFFILQVAALIDYRLAYSRTWFHISTYPIDYNIVSLIAFALAIFNEVLNEIESENMKLANG